MRCRCSISLTRRLAPARSDAGAVEQTQYNPWDPLLELRSPPARRGPGNALLLCGPLHRGQPYSRSAVRGFHRTICATTWPGRWRNRTSNSTSYPGADHPHRMPIEDARYTGRSGLSPFVFSCKHPDTAAEDPTRRPVPHSEGCCRSIRGTACRSTAHSAMRNRARRQMYYELSRLRAGAVKPGHELEERKAAATRGIPVVPREHHAILVVAHQHGEARKAWGQGPAAATGPGTGLEP